MLLDAVVVDRVVVDSMSTTVSTWLIGAADSFVGDRTVFVVDVVGLVAGEVVVVASVVSELLVVVLCNVFSRRPRTSSLSVLDNRKGSTDFLVSVEEIENRSVMQMMRIKETS